MCYRHDVVIEENEWIDPDAEIWHPIIDYPGYYASESGCITHNGSPIKPKEFNKYGHSQVRMYKNGKQYAEETHRVIAKSFIPNPNNYPLVRHRDNNPRNNAVYNLAWGTYADNTRDSIEAGTFVYNYHNFTKDELRRSIETNRTPVKAIDITTNSEKIFYSQQEAARQLHLSQGNINMVLNGRRNHTGGYRFEYVNKESV